jgi:hypothetical protein
MLHDWDLSGKLFLLLKNGRMIKYPDTAPLPIVFSRFWGYGRWSHFWYVFEWRVVMNKMTDKQLYEIRERVEAEKQAWIRPLQGTGEQAIIDREALLEELDRLRKDYEDLSDNYEEAAFAAWG